MSLVRCYGAATLSRGCSLSRAKIRLPQLLSLLSLAALLALALACGGGSDSQSVSDSEQGQEPNVIHLPTRWTAGIAESLDSLVQHTDASFVGRVVALESLRSEPIGNPDAPRAPVDGKPPTNNSPSIPVSTFEVEVVRALSGDVADNSTVLIEQIGGEVTVPDGRRQTILLEADEMILAGEEYLFFVAEKSDGVYTGAPFARFHLQDGTFRAPAVWSDVPVAAQIAGSDTGAVAREISNVSR